ncbi:MAG: outer membrane lipoprotein-sorting protein [Thermodesulfobacteriota bacterium]|nr:outer membrane lipoprotein-sorting protein [Thermodesulfobacteriota bacterium]
MKDWPETTEEIELIKQRTLDNPLYKNFLISEDSKMTTIVIQIQTYSSVGTDSDALDGFEDDAKKINATDDKQYLTDKENSEVVASVDKGANKYRSPDFEIYIAGSSAVTHFLKQSRIKDVRRFLLLAFDYDDPDKDDDQWLYLPALKKTKRIASTDKSDSFMGSDLTYSDMTSRNLEDYDYTFYEKAKEKK